MTPSDPYAVAAACRGADRRRRSHDESGGEGAVPDISLDGRKTQSGRDLVAL